MASGASVDGCFARNAVPTDRAIDGNMRRDIALFESLDKVEDVVALSPPSVMSRRGGRSSSHARTTSRSAVPVAWVTSPQWPAIAVFHDRVAHVAKPALSAVALAIEPCVRIGCAFVRLVGPLLAPEVLLAIASRAWSTREAT